MRRHRPCLPWSDYDFFSIKVLMRRRTCNLISCLSAAELDASVGTVKNASEPSDEEKVQAEPLPELLRVADKLKSIAQPTLPNRCFSRWNIDSKDLISKSLVQLA